MIKKLILALIVLCITVSCGKKGDPEYKDPKNKTEIDNMNIEQRSHGSDDKEAVQKNRKDKKSEIDNERK